MLGGENIELSGGGTLDGAGQAWYDALWVSSWILLGSGNEYDSSAVLLMLHCFVRLPWLYPEPRMLLLRISIWSIVQSGSTWYVLSLLRERVGLWSMVRVKQQVNECKNVSYSNKSIGLAMTEPRYLIGDFQQHIHQCGVHLWKLHRKHWWMGHLPEWHRHYQKL